MVKQKKILRDTEWLETWYPRILGFVSLIALVASFWQATERVQMLKTPTASLSCNINPIVDCGGVMSHKLASLFGFPNAFIGIVLFSMLFTSAIILLTGGVFTKYFHFLVIVISKVVAIFSLWFFWVSLFVIGKVCLFCLIIWPSSLIVFWYGLLYWLAKQSKQSSFQKKLLSYGLKNHYLVVVYLLVLMFALYLFRFRDYYFS